jgi:hypothetical protein
MMVPGTQGYVKCVECARDSGCRGLRIDDTAHRCWFGARAFREGDLITIYGETGHVFGDRLAVVTEKPHEALATIAQWRARA